MALAQALADARRLRVPRAVIDATWTALRGYGQKRLEGFALWVGHVQTGTAQVEAVIVPPQHSISGEDGVGYFIDTETLFAINVQLNERKLSLLAQIHSHPAEAYHSATDDRYAIVTTEGGFSIVVPDFAVAAPDPLLCAVYRLKRGDWRRLDGAEVKRSMAWSDQ